ncbi:hypothetical protein V8F06_014822, partial [Rhypophila decipiens]
MLGRKKLVPFIPSFYFIRCLWRPLGGFLFFPFFLLFFFLFLFPFSFFFPFFSLPPPPFFFFFSGSFIPY